MELWYHHNNFYFKWFVESQIVSFMEKNDKWLNSISHAYVYTSWNSGATQSC